MAETLNLLLLWFQLQQAGYHRWVSFGGSERLFFCHETAFVEDDVTIGAGTRVWHECHLRNGSVIGRNCVLGKNVMVDVDVQIGDEVKIQNNVAVYHGVTIGNGVFVGPAAVFTNDLVPRARNSNWKITETHVRDGASIGANATIVCGVVIGENSMIGAGSVVTRDVPPHALVLGNPARIRGWVCICGSRIGHGEERPEKLLCGECTNLGEG